MIQLYPTKAFYKVISEDDSVTEIDYISADEEGNLFIEKHLNKLNQYSVRLKLE